MTAMPEITPLAAENAGICARFERDGVNLDEQTSVEFICEFPQVEDARACRKALRGHFRESGLPAGVNDLLYVVCDYTKNAEPSETRLTVNMVPTVERVTIIERAFNDVAARQNGGTVCWEFEEPRKVS